MSGLPIEVVVVLGGVGLVALLWLLLRFGKQIARAVLIGGILAIGVIVALALFNQASASKEAARAATVAASGQAVTSVGMALCVGVLGTVAVGALGFGGFWYARYQLEEKRRREQLPRQRQAQALPPVQQEPVVYYVQGERDTVDLDKLDLSKWGW